MNRKFINLGTINGNTVSIAKAYYEGLWSIKVNGKPSGYTNYPQGLIKSLD